MGTVLEDGTEVFLPCPESWSDSDDDAARFGDGAAGAGAGADDAGGETAAGPINPGGMLEQKNESVRPQALGVLASIPSHNHAERGLAEASSAGFAALAALAELPPHPEQVVPVLQTGAISAADFAARFVGGEGRPAVIQGVPESEGWPAWPRWRTQRGFLARFGALPVQVTEMFAAHGIGRPYRVELPLEDYVEYARANTFDWPFYVWERNFNGERRRFLDDFRAPSVLSDDLYDTSPEIRDFLPLTCHLFVLVGGRRTGSNMHKDPKWSSAWNTVLCGRKRWVMFPREVPAEEIGALSGDAYKDGGPQAYWWLDHYPRLREQGAKLGMVDIVQGPGDTVFIPAGWWHAVLNLPGEGEDVTIACTRNVLPPSSLPFVLPRMREADPAFTRFFLETVRRLRPDAPEFLPTDLAPPPRPQKVGDCESWLLERRSAASLSLAACRRDFVRAGKPLIIDGLDPHLLSVECCGLSREWLSANFGEKCVAVYRNFRDPREREYGESDKAELLRLREVLALLRQGGEEAQGLYLYDMSLPLQLPGLLEHVRLPRYFAHCYLQQTRSLHCFSRSWPTLFIGSRCSQAKLHVDQWHGHFWMHMISGRKRWTIFHPEDAHLLGPSTPEGRVHPTFPELRELEEGSVAGAPDFARARRLEVVLEEGETLFVPGGAPHLVVNLTDTVAVAGNFLDESNFDKALADLRAMSAREASNGTIAQAVASLDEIDFEPDLSMHEDLLDPRQLVVKYRDFAGGTAARWGPRPPDDDVDF